MISANGRFVVAYNGEIYNHRELRLTLEGDGCRLTGHSDTEILLEGCARWGVEATFTRLIGMFALALWDRLDRKLYLIRDRLGIKPLYWGRIGNRLIFGSELKALKRHPDWQPEIDRRTLATYFRFGYVPAPFSIYRGIQKLSPGDILTFDRKGKLELRPYWSLSEVAEQGQACRLDLSDQDSIDHLESLLSDAVGRVMIADVPVGAFLSGGIDSSTVVALMQRQSTRNVKTFSIGFSESSYDEASDARAVAAHLGTDHTEIHVSPADAMRAIPKLPHVYDEPFADPSQIPTLLLCELTSRHVVVALSGDGGDELFGGYPRYLMASSLWRQLARVPKPARAVAAATLDAVSPTTWTNLFSMLPRRFAPRLAGDKAHKLSRMLRGAPDDFYSILSSQWDDPTDIVVGAAEHCNAMSYAGSAALVPGKIERMQFLDTQSYLPDDILTKVDRASMSVGLEARVPLLDHRVVEFSWKLPVHLKVRYGQGKWLLRQVLHRYLPSEMIQRPKMGFGVPIDRWLRGPLREWAETLLDQARLRREGWLNPEPIRNRWSQHLEGRRNWQSSLWCVLMFEAWLEQEKASSTGGEHLCLPYQS